LLSVIVVRFAERHSLSDAAPPMLYFVLATIDLALTLTLYFAPAAPLLPHGSLSQSPGVYLGLGASVLGFVSIIPLQRVRGPSSRRSENGSAARF
jgi:hypothetical protein